MSLYQNVRKACDQRVWMQGRRLADAGAVSLERTEGEELNLLVNEKITQSYTVYLWQDDEDWDCDCSSVDSPCHHIAAAVIALHEDKASKKKRRRKKIGYRFVRSKTGLVFDRVLIEKGKEELFSGSVFKVKHCQVQDWDRELEKILYNRFHRVLSKSLLKDVLAVLEQSEKINVKLCNRKVKISSQDVVPIGVVEDDDDGFRVRLAREPGIQEVYGGGAVLCNDTLRVTSRGKLTDEQYHRLSQGIRYSRQDIRHLVCNILPKMRERIPVDVRTTRLPPSVELRPYIKLEVWSEEEALAIHPHLYYGDPAVAVVEGEQLRVIGDFVPIRDEQEELRLKRRLSNLLNVPVSRKSLFFGQKAIDFATKVEKYSEFEKGWETSSIDFSSFRKEDSFEPSIHIEENDFHIDWGRASAQRVISAWQKGDSLVRLENGGWAPIPKAWMDEYGGLVVDLLAAREANNNNHVPKYALFDLAKLCAKLDKPAPPKLEPLKLLLQDFTGIAEATLPSDLNATLRSYQHVGVNWLSFLQQAEMGGILADDMGLGKTLQALCVLKKRSLVVAPTSVLHNWKQEAERFRPELTCCVYHGSNRVYDHEADVMLTSYAILRNSIDELSQENWNVVVLDEAQAIKNPRSQTAQAAFRLKAKFRATLTGTPIENRLEELWSQIHFLCPGFLAGIQDFRRRYEVPISNGDANAAKELRDRIRPFVLRRIKKEVAPELPSRTELTLKCNLSGEERGLYNAVRLSTRQELVKNLENGKFSVMHALEALLRLRQAACHSGLLHGQNANSSSKIELLIEQLLQLISAGHKAIVFSQWTQLLDRIEPHFHTNNIDFVRLDGTTRDRQSIVERFQSDSGPPVFLSSLKAGGTGINLTAADHVFLMDPWWNPAVEDQAADRAHRIGQDKPVMIYRIVADQTVEERILELQKKKRRLADAALGNASQAAAITKQELLELLA